MKPNDSHLNESQIILAATDQNDLPDAARRHLSVCAVCQKEKERFEDGLNHIACMATKFSPTPQKKIQLLLPSSAGIWKLATPSCKQRQIFINGIFVTLLLFISSWMMLNHEENTARVIREMEADQRLIAEIQYLEENIMPDIYTDISEEYYEYFDEEFMDFVVPVEENRNSV